MPLGTGRRLGRSLAVHDWLLLVYFALLALALVDAAPHPARAGTLARLLALFAATAAAIGGVRLGLVRPPLAAALLYRAAVVGSLPASYFLLRALLPIVNPAAYDHELRAIDLWLFGGDPVVWLDRFVTPATTEWFAFFYYGYFVLLAAYVLPLLVDRRGWLRAECGVGIVLVFTTAHVLYMIVPGWGPYRAFPEAFPTPLPSGPWLNAVRDAVAHGGALKDIFPSLHTAAPVYLLLFSVRHRRARPFNVVWPLMAVVTANLVAATVFLRWHYVVDVVAGLALALGAHLAAPRIARWETARRARLGLDDTWPPLAARPRLAGAGVGVTPRACGPAARGRARPPGSR